MTRVLAAVAMGREAPDLIITGARVISTYSERMREECEVWIKGGRIAAVKPAGSYPVLPGDRTIRYDAEGGILAPGLIDPHLHIESSMMTACAYAEPALLNGTTTIFCDCHEIANVCDVRGVEWMFSDARFAPLSIFATVPSTVPATSSQWETAGGDLTAQKIGRVFDQWPEAVGLGEKMDFVHVAAGDLRSHAILAEALRRGRPVSGHIYGREFVAANAASGVSDTHEAIDRDIAEDCLEAGLWVLLRGGPPGSPWHSLPEAVKIVTELGVSTKRICLCTDDRDPHDLFHYGMDWVVRQAVQAGIGPLVAWSMGSLHAATRFGMDQEIGAIAPARRADIVLLNDQMEVQNTWYGGQLMVEGRRITPELDRALSRRYKYPRPAYKTMRLPRRPKLIPDCPPGPVLANAIRVVPSGIVAAREQITLPGASEWGGMLENNDLCFLTVVERHGSSGAVAHGLLRGFGLRKGAVASSVGHDAHNVLVAGTNEADMRAALTAVKQAKGGVCVVRDGQVLALVSLPVAGLLSDKRAPDVAAEMKAVKAAWEKAGCVLPYMGFNLLSLSVIPELRLTDKGLVTVPGMQVLPLFESLPPQPIKPGPGGPRSPEEATLRRPAPKAPRLRRR